MKVVLQSRYRGNYYNARGQFMGKQDLAPGEHELDAELVEFLKRDAPGVFAVAPEIPVKKEVAAPPRNKMVSSGALTTKNTLGKS